MRSEDFLNPSQTLGKNSQIKRTTYIQLFSKPQREHAMKKLKASLSILLLFFSLHHSVYAQDKLTDADRAGKSHLRRCALGSIENLFLKIRKVVVTNPIKAN